ncbi:MAG: hypothetical protein FJZ96_13805 [Chloroflexi bacterium]|nr:hypothetical protein [Chloroflexota bacterium]
MAYFRIGMIARWRPVHLGQAAILRALCRRGDQALIGIGSSNRYNLRNPFTLEETCNMLKLTLVEFTNYTLLPVPDLDDGPRWREQVLRLFGALDVFVSDNPYVTSLLQGDYEIIKPVTLVPEDEQCPIDGSMVRHAMARGDGWQALVPQAVAEYIRSSELDQRFRREFGLEALALQSVIS